MAAGGAVIAPWEVAQLTEEWLTGAREINQGLRKFKERQATERLMDSKMAAWRNSHPAYHRRH